MGNHNKKIVIFADDPTQKKLWASVRYIQERLINIFGLFKDHEIQVIYLKHEQKSIVEISDRNFEGAYICYLTYMNHLEDIFSENPSLLHPQNEHFIWTFGNITHYPHLWLKRLILLQKQRVCFVCASRSAEEQLKNIFSGAETYVLPYFVDTPKQSAKNYSETEPYVFAYGGRFVRSKGVDILLESFFKLSQKYLNIRLILYGEAHYRNYILHGIHQVPMIMNHAVQRALIKSPQLNWVKGLTPEDFERELGKINCYVSLSTYHDEDFGISLRQAYYSGARLLGTYWGGQKDTLDLQKDSLKIRVHHGVADLLPKLNIEDVYVAMEEAYLSRSKLRESPLDNNKVDYLAQLENLLFRSPVRIFNLEMDLANYSEFFLASNHFPFQKKNPQSEYYYEKLYHCYY